MKKSKPRPLTVEESITLSKLLIFNNLYLTHLDQVRDTKIYSDKLRTAINNLEQKLEYQFKFFFTITEESPATIAELNKVNDELLPVIHLLDQVMDVLVGTDIDKIKKIADIVL